MALGFWRIASILLGAGVASVGCSDNRGPSESDVMAQIRTAIETRSTASSDSVVRKYFPDLRYQKISRMKYMGGKLMDENTYTAIVHISYEYTVPYLRVIEDLERDGPPRETTFVPGFESIDRVRRSVFNPGDKFEIDGVFTFSKTAEGWRLQ
jgi:hypothetical protein